MLECPECHIECQEDKKFCKNCGTPLIPMTYEHKDEEIPEPSILPEKEAYEETESLVVPKESNQTSQYCPECGTEYEEGKRFCKNCGVALTPQLVSAKEKPVLSTQKRLDFIPPEKMIKKSQIKAWVKEGVRLSREKDKLELLLANLERQRHMIPATLFKETQGRYTQQLGVINKRLQEVETISWQARTQLDSQIEALKNEMEPFRTDYASIRSLYKAGGLIRKDFKLRKKGAKKQIRLRNKQLCKRGKLLKIISSRLSQEGFIVPPVWYKTRLARFALIWPSLVLGALLVFGGSYYIAASYLGWWLPFSSLSPTTTISETTGPPSKVEVLPETGKSPPSIESAVPTETDPIKKVFEDIKTANIKKDIDLFLSCYSSSYPELEARKESILKNWETFDFIDLTYDLRDKDVQGDEARLTVEWNTKAISKADGQLNEFKTLLKVVFRKEEGIWKIIQTEQRE